MKYLKKFNESCEREQAIGEELEYIRDILIPIVDMGFDVDVYKPWSATIACVVTIEQGDRKSWWGKDEIEKDNFSSTIQHIVNYMNSFDYTEDEEWQLIPPSLILTFKRK